MNVIFFFKLIIDLEFENMSGASSLPFIQQCFTRYGMTAYVILGNIGLLINIGVFSQPVYRRKSYSLYILTMSIYGLLALNVCTIPIIYGAYHTNPSNYIYLFCEIQFYFRHALMQLTRAFAVLACADRYASCSNQASIRAFSQYEVALKAIPCMTLFWLVVAIYPTMLRTLDNGVCDARSGVEDILYTTYIVFVLGFLPVICLSVFGILMTKNLKGMRNRIQPATSSNSTGPILRKRDRDLIKMFLIELIIYIILTIPNTVMHIYVISVVNLVKSKERQLIEAFAVYVARVFLLYLGNAFSFWVYISTSVSYRLEIKNLFIKWYKFVIRN